MGLDERTLKLVEEFSGVEGGGGVEGVFDGLVNCKICGADGLLEPALFGEADSMFAGDGASVCEDPVEKLVEGFVGGLLFFGVVVVFDHEVDVDVAITGVTEAGEGDSGVGGELLCELDEVDELGARDDDVFVEFGQARGSQRVGELAAELPDGFASFFVAMGLDGEGSRFCEEGFQLGKFGFDGGIAAIDFDNEVSLAGWKGIRAQVVAGRLEGESVGDFESRGEVARVENGLDGGGGFRKLGEGGGEHGPSLGVGNDAKGCFSHDS